jgi:serine/threonine protein phosphatase PrpC
MTNLVEEMLLLDAAHEPEQVEMKVAGGTAVAYSCREPGKETENEDSVAIIPYGPGAAAIVVADGAGGLPAGKRASLTAVTTLAESLQSAMDKTTLLRTAILNGIEAANDAVLGLANGSATTMTVITIEGLIARSYQIGDSEAIIVGQRGLVKLQTTAHSPTGFAVEAGFLDEREALHHEERHLVSNFLGTSDMRIDVGATVKLNPRDTIIVASDGLMDNVLCTSTKSWSASAKGRSQMRSIVPRSWRRNACRRRMRANQASRTTSPSSFSGSRSARPINIIKGLRVDRFRGAYYRHRYGT